MSTDKPIRLFTVSETSKMLRLSISKVYRMLSIGELSCIQIGTRKMVTYEDILQFVELHRKQITQRPAAKKRHF